MKRGDVDNAWEDRWCDVSRGVKGDLISAFDLNAQAMKQKR